MKTTRVVVCISLLGAISIVLGCTAPHSPPKRGTTIAFPDDGSDSAVELAMSRVATRMAYLEELRQQAKDLLPSRHLDIANEMVKRLKADPARKLHKEELLRALRDFDADLRDEIQAYDAAAEADPLLAPDRSHQSGVGH